MSYLVKELFLSPTVYHPVRKFQFGFPDFGDVSGRFRLSIRSAQSWSDRRRTFPHPHHDRFITLMHICSIDAHTSPDYEGSYYLSVPS
jgi:hypothetical protein